jgi:redox-sensitive bicupin YhaK (pirin superfamily)
MTPITTPAPPVNEKTTKPLLKVYGPGSTHVVGDGFHVRNFIPSHDLDRALSPFVMLDYAGPTFYPATTTPRGVGEHPHRGFETVTIVYDGVVAHRDSAGNAGVIGPGDVQWMTAASGVVHEEKHEREFAKKGGTLHAIQLWVNLPKAVKMSPPKYQTILNADIPSVPLAGGGSVRVIAGTFDGATGPAKTFTPVHLYDAQVPAGSGFDITVPRGYTTAVLVLSGDVRLNGRESAAEAQLAVFGAEGERVRLEARADARLLVLAGEPIAEPIARYGPFVMNTQDELYQAVKDYQAGLMGHLD